MGRAYKIAFGIWTAVVLLLFLRAAAEGLNEPTCGNLSSVPCPGFEIAAALLVFSVFWVIGFAALAVALRVVSWAFRRRRRYDPS